MDTKDLIGIKEGAALCGMSPQLMRYYVINNIGPKFEKIGHSFFLDRKSVLNWKKPKPRTLGRPKQC